MIHLEKVLELCSNGKPHDFKFIAKGSDKDKRDGGYLVTMKNSVVTSSYQMGTINLKSLDSGEVRKCYNILIVEFDGNEVFI